MFEYASSSRFTSILAPLYTPGTTDVCYMSRFMPIITHPKAQWQLVYASPTISLQSRTPRSARATECALSHASRQSHAFERAGAIDALTWHSLPGKCHKMRCGGRRCGHNDTLLGRSALNCGVVTVRGATSAHCLAGSSASATKCGVVAEAHPLSASNCGAVAVR